MKPTNLNIEFKKPIQIINMGGPWIGDLFVNHQRICDKAIQDNIVIHKKTNSLFFIKYHLVSKWRTNNFFTVNRFDFLENQLQESTLKFDNVFIEEGESESEIVTFNAFHSEFKDSGITRPIDSLELINYRLHHL